MVNGSKQELAGALRSVNGGSVRALQPAPRVEPSNKEGFQIVVPKRKRGRPYKLDRLEAGTTRIDNAFAQARSQSIAVSVQGDQGIIVKGRTTRGTRTSRVNCCLKTS